MIRPRSRPYACLRPTWLVLYWLRTNVPRPTALSSRPRSTSSLLALATVSGLWPMSSAMSRSAGSFVPAASEPSAIRSASQSVNWMYTGTAPGRSWKSPQFKATLSKLCPRIVINYPGRPCMTLQGHGHYEAGRMVVERAQHVRLAQAVIIVATSVDGVQRSRRACRKSCRRAVHSFRLSCASLNRVPCARPMTSREAAFRLRCTGLLGRVHRRSERARPVLRIAGGLSPRSHGRWWAGRRRAIRLSLPACDCVAGRREPPPRN